MTWIRGGFSQYWAPIKKAKRILSGRGLATLTGNSDTVFQEVIKQKRYQETERHKTKNYRLLSSELGGCHSSESQLSHTKGPLPHLARRTAAPAVDCAPWRLPVSYTELPRALVLRITVVSIHLRILTSHNRIGKIQQLPQSS